MPIYEYSCQCGYSQDEWRRVDERHNAPKHCGKSMSIVFSPTRVLTDIKPYRSMVTGEMITSRSRHRDHLKRHDLIEVGNEVETMMKPRQKVKLSNEKRKKRIAEILNSRT